MFADLSEIFSAPGIWTLLGLALSLLAAAATGVHVLLKKRDARSAAYWLVIVTFVPLLGSLF